MAACFSYIEAIIRLHSNYDAAYNMYKDKIW